MDGQAKEEKQSSVSTGAISLMKVTVISVSPLLFVNVFSGFVWPVLFPFSFSHTALLNALCW